MAKIQRKNKNNGIFIVVAIIIVVILSIIIAMGVLFTRIGQEHEAKMEMETLVAVEMTKFVVSPTPSQMPMPTATLIPTLPLPSTPTLFPTPVPEREDEGTNEKVPVVYGDGFVMEFKGFRPESLTARLSPEKAIAYPLIKGEGSSGCEYEAEGDVWLFGDTTAAHAGIEDTGVFSWRTEDIASALVSIGENPDDYYIVGDATALSLLEAESSGEEVFASSRKGNTFVFSLISASDHVLVLNSGAWYAVHRENFDGYLLLRYRHLSCRGKTRMPLIIQGGYPSGSVWSDFTSTTEVDAYIASHQ